MKKYLIFIPILLFSSAFAKESNLKIATSALFNRYNLNIPLKKTIKQYWSPKIIFYDEDQRANNLNAFIKGTNNIRKQMRFIKIFLQDSMVDGNHVALIYFILAQDKKSKDIYLVKEMSLYTIVKGKITSIRELEQWIHSHR